MACVSLLKSPQDAPLSLRRKLSNVSHFFFCFAIANFLSNRPPFTFLYVCKFSLSAFFSSLEVRCKMLLKHYRFKCKCNFSYCKWTSSSNMKSFLIMNPLLACLREGKAICGHSQVFSLDRYSNCASF